MMKKIFSREVHRSVRAFLAVVISFILAAPPVWANPAGGAVAQGSASFSSSGSQLTIQTSDRASINWQSFNIGVGETTTFVQPSASSVVWNQINDVNASQILGTLNANGYVVLANPNGFYVGGQASINSHGLVMTTANVPAPNLSAPGAWQFNALPPAANIVNYGQINADRGGSVFLIAHNVENHGTISAPEGSIGLFAGKQVLVSTRPDGRGLSAEVTLPEGSVDNSGRLVADAGEIAMRARVVNQGGLVQANSVRDVNGTIELYASDTIHLTANSDIRASGGDGVSQGGTVLIKSDNVFSDESGSVVRIGGGTDGGNGGVAEISAPFMDAIHSTIDGRSAAGFVNGQLTIDPLNINLVSSGGNGTSDEYNSGVVDGSTPPAAGTLTLNVTAFASTLSQINLQAVNDITVTAAWTLTDRSSAATLTLSAGNNITFKNGALIKAGNNWSVNLLAGTSPTAAAESFTTPANIVLSRLQGIYLDGNSSIQTLNGDISLWANREVILNPGGNDRLSTDSQSPAVHASTGNGIRTVGGGNISVVAAQGDVNTGGNPNGYLFNGTTAPYYRVNAASLGGVSTAAGGNVEIHAGGNVTSFLPLQVNYDRQFTQARFDGGTGAFGPQAGNVTITANGNISGHYVVANGVGSITAGGTIGAPTAAGGFALSLIKGSWNVSAGRDLFLQEVRNPNGTFNNTVSGTSVTAGFHLFDYDPLASVRLQAGNAVEITGAGAPHAAPSGTPGQFDPAVPFVLPPSLEIVAGAGGVALDLTGPVNPLVLFRSPYSDLRITTFNGGNFRGNNSFLVMSGSEARQWVRPADRVGLFSTFGTFLAGDVGPTPVQFDNLDPVEISVSGNVTGLTLYTSKATHMTVGGDMFNTSLLGVNLHSADRTTIDVAGSIGFSPTFAFVNLDEPLSGVDARHPQWDSLFDLLLDPTRALTTAVNIHGNITDQLDALRLLDTRPRFFYDPVTLQLGFQYQMPQNVRDALVGPLVAISLDASGRPLVVPGDAKLGQDPNKFYFEIQPVTFAPPSVIEQLYVSSQRSVSAEDSQSLAGGFRIGGPGEFIVNADSIDLGSSGGIISAGIVIWGDSVNFAAQLPDSGASVHVNVAGDLRMITSTIASYSGGDVNVHSGGEIALSLGGFIPPIDRNPDLPAYGIFTSGHSDVNVTANGDIDIGTARIAAFRNGNVFVRSENGDVNAGNGANMILNVLSTGFDPIGGLLLRPAALNPYPFGSGIIALSVDRIRNSAVLPGNITVQAPRGNIISTLGGISQFALNGVLGPGPVVTLTAGTPPSGDEPGITGNVDLGAGGVIGGEINVTAQGSIKGLIVSREDSNVNAAQSFTGILLAGGTANVSAQSSGGPTLIIGIAGVNASGSGVGTATLLGQNVTVGGAASQSTLGTAVAATATSAAAAGEASSDTREKVASASSGGGSDENKDRKLPPIRRVGRVTVVLPPA